MTIRYFKVLQSVLSQTRDVICHVHGLSKEEAFERSETFIQENSRRWRSSDPALRYEDPFCRMAYLYMNVAIHASLVEYAVAAFKETLLLFQNWITDGRELRLCALGGGPGSELLGIVRFIEMLGIRKTGYLDFALVDKVREWDESWHALKQGVDEQLKEQYGRDRSLWPVLTSRSFLPLDVTKVDDFRDFATRFNSIDLFICCYLVSELKEHIKHFAETLQLLVGRASSGALLLFIDRDEKQVRETVQQIIRDDPSLTAVGTKQERGRLTEDLKDLGEWYINIPSLPRQKWLTFFSLVRKS